MTKIVLGVLAFLLLVTVLYAAPHKPAPNGPARAAPKPPPQAPKYSLGGGKTRLGATAAGGVPVVQRIGVSIDGSGTTLILVQYLNAAGISVHTRAITSPPCATPGPIVDQFGTQLAATQPASLCNAVTAFVTQLDGLIENAATAGKLAL